MKTVTISEARRRLSALLVEVESSERVLVTRNGHPSAVIVSIEEWESIDDTAFWRLVPGVSDDIATARSERGISIEEFAASRLDDSARD